MQKKASDHSLKVDLGGSLWLQYYLVAPLFVSHVTSSYVFGGKIAAGTALKSLPSTHCRPDPSSVRAARGVAQMEFSNSNVELSFDISSIKNNVEQHRTIIVNEISGYYGTFFIWPERRAHSCTIMC